MSAVPFKVKAVYEYKSAEPDDLNFPNGQIITVTAIEDDDWYTGNYVDTAGGTREGLFPKNFVEKYEPAIPSRPKRAQLKTEAPAEVRPPVAAVQETEDVAPSRKSVEAPRESEPEQIPAASPPLQAAVHKPPPAVAELSVAPMKTPYGKPAPPVAEKPSSGSFRDRIAAFNKTAAPPPTPFKPATQNNSTGFIKKPFVAPPPSKNAYVPPPREQPPPKVYRREEDPETAREEHTTERAEAPVTAPEDDEDAPKPMTLKERMALLQKQQMEQAQRHAEGTQKKDKPKRPPKKRMESTEKVETVEATTDAPPERVHTDETVGKKSVDFADDEAGPLRGNLKASHDRNTMATPPPPARELVSDTNDADDSGAGDTEDAQETSTEEERPKSKQGEHVPGAFTAEPESTTHHREAEPEDEDEEEEADDTDEDPEIKRRREIRDRMAKMSGGMGMMGMFGPPGGMPGASSARKSRPSGEADRKASKEQTQDDQTRAPPVPVMAMPGMTRPPPPPADEESDEDTAHPTPQPTAPRDLSDADDDLPAPPTRKSTDRAAPPVPNDRGLPPPSPREARAAPPPPPSERSVPSQANDFASAPPPPSRTTRPQTAEDDIGSRPQSKEGPPSLPPAPPRRPTEPPHIDTSLPTSPSDENKRLSRGLPPISMISPTTASQQTKAPPPPPPGQPPSRRSTTDSRISSSKHPINGDSEEEVTEYEGDYDTDIASSAKHKDALKSHNRDSSLDDGILTDEAAAKSPSIPPARAVPSIPMTSAPRDVPPPLPPQGAPKSRKSFDAPRAAPPPVPPPKEAADDNEYDPYRYNGHQAPVSSPPSRSGYAPVLASPAEEMEQDDMYDPTPTATRSFAPPLTERNMPPPPSSAAPIIMTPGRTSMEAPRGSMQARRSMEQSSGEHSIMATDIDLGQSSMWWIQRNTPPPSLKNRLDVLYEIESSTSTKRGGKATTSTDIYVLYSDYSQTTINATFDPQEPSHAALEQRHERPPPPPRKDQLEAASQQFGTRIAESASAKLNTTVGSGTPQDFVFDLLAPLYSQALRPIGTRSFGALVYANLANTSTQVFDEIRPGDIVTFRNAKFGGHKGTMRQKYSVDVGMVREHVGVVAEWDGTKKKIRVWEQGHEEKGKKGKVKEESWRMGDLRSGEVRVWRVMGRQWVGWDSSK
jgi:myosin tail region-interacting protein MTI1